MESEDLDTTLRIYPFMDAEDEDDVICELLSLDCEDCMFDFIVDHWGLCEDHVVETIESILSGDGEKFDQVIHELFHYNPHRTEFEISEAYSQVRDRRWYAQMPKEERLNLADDSEVKEVLELEFLSKDVKYEDIDDPKYKTPYGQGYLAGVQAALSWSQGQSWGDTDI